MRFLIKIAKKTINPKIFKRSILSISLIFFVTELTEAVLSNFHNPNKRINPDKVAKLKFLRRVLLKNKKK